MASFQDSALTRAAAQFRAQIIAGEAKAVKPLLAAYSSLYARTNAQLKQILAEIEREVATGKAPGVARLYERNRLARILGQVGTELVQIGAQASTIANAQQLALIQQAGRDAKHFAEVALGPKPSGFTGVSWAEVPAGEIESLAGLAGDGSPLKKLFNYTAPNGANRVRDAIVQGVALGRDERVIGAQIQQILGGNMGRALTIVRTESMRAYRESQRQAFALNSDVIIAVRWFASLSSDTCPACLALHGKEFPPDYVMEAHPNCRCVLVPVTQGETRGFESGEQWFARQNLEKQMKILGPQGFEAYYRGQVKLSDFIGHRHNDEWGGMYHTLPLKEALKPGNSRPKPQPPAKPIEPIEPAKPKPVRKSKPKVAPKPPAAQPPKPLPAWKVDSVADSLDLKVKGKLKDQVTHAIEQIEQVHGVEGLPTIPLQSTTSKKYYGAYEHFISGKPHAIKIKTGGPHVELTTCHEIGHFLDHQVLGTPGKFASFGPELAEWRDAVEKSQAFKELNDLLSKKSVTVILNNGSEISYPLKKSYIKYLLDKEELFARSYAQYIAKRSNSPTLIAQLDGIRNNTSSPYHMQQWTDEDFEPIAEALDKIFADKDWLKMKP